MKKRMRARLIGASLALLILYSVFPAVGLAESRPEYITVGLKYGSTAVSECVLQSDNGFQIVNVTEEGPENTLPLPAYREIVASMENGKVTLRDSGGTLLVSDLSRNSAIMPLNYEGGEGTVTVFGKVYRDGIQLTPYQSSSMNVINYITMDHYLYGVIHAEMSQSYPLEALKAQAVVARSYAGNNQHAHSEYGFDVCTTTHCQVYQGYAGEYPKTTQAVDETSGIMLYSGGKVVQVFYFKNSGGHTQNSEDVWSAAEPYLRGVRDPYSPDYPWEVELSFEQIQSRLESAGYRPGAIRSIAITGRNDAGAVSELTIEGSSSTVVLKRDSVRTVIGSSDIKSTMFDLKNSVGSGGAPSEAKGVYVTDGHSVEKAEEKLFLISASGSVEERRTEEVYLTDGSRITTGDQSTGNGVDFSGSYGVVTGGTAVFSGKGYGHGVGMPQDSAIAMAEQGCTFEEILEYFFTGIEIR